MDTLAEHLPVASPQRLYSSYAWLLVATYQVIAICMQLNASLYVMLPYTYTYCYTFRGKASAIDIFALMQLLEGVHLRKELEPIVWKHFVDHIVPAIKQFQCTQKIERRHLLTKEQVEVFIDKALQNQPTSVVSLLVFPISVCIMYFLWLGTGINFHQK